MDSLNIVQKFIDQQGWSDNSVITLLCDFIDQEKRYNQLQAFLKKQSEEENSLTGENQES